MHVECELSKALQSSASDQHLKGRLALSALCNNSSEHPYDSYSSRATSLEGSRLSQNPTSSSSSSLRANPVSPPPFAKRIDAPKFATSRRLPSISDLKLFSQNQRSVSETALVENGCLSHEIRNPIHSRALHHVAYHDMLPSPTQVISRKPCPTSSSVPCNVPSNAPPFSPSPLIFSKLAFADGIQTDFPTPEVQSYVMTHRKWSPPKAPQPTSLSPPPEGFPATSSCTRRTYHSKRTARVCANCGITQTRQWVRGENQTWLCHSCGQFWRKNGYSRPRALWNRPTFKRSSRKLKLTSQCVGDTRRAKGSTRQTVSSSFLDGKKMIQLETYLPRLPRDSVLNKVQNVMKMSDSLKTRYEVNA